MITGIFGDKQFAVTGNLIYTPSDTSISESVDIEETEKSGQKPTTKIKGIKLQTVGFDILLDARFVSVITELRYWKSVLLAKSPKDFTLGEYKIGRFYLSQYSVSDIQINKKGEWIKAKLSISLTEDGNYAGSTTTNFSGTRYVTQVTTSLAAKTTKEIRVGSEVKPVSGTRVYGTAYSAVNKTGTSNKVEDDIYIIKEIYRVTSMDSPTYGVFIDKSVTGCRGWMRSEDLILVKY